MAGKYEGKRVAVVGGGFGGLHTTQQLKHVDARVAIIDRQNYHLFQPLLYQVATAVLSPADIANPIRRIFRNQPNVHVVWDRVETVDPDEQTLTLSHGVMSYDYLVLAAGATHSYFGNDQWEDLAPGLKTVDDALEIRRRVLAAFEMAEREADEHSRRAHLTFVIVGGGPTGVELAGALKEIAVDSMPSDFRNIDTTTTRVVLVEGGSRLLGAMPEECGRRARRDLEQMGVEVMTDTLVTGMDETGVTLKNGDRIEAQNVMWAAGVKPSPLGQALGVDLDRAGRVKVEHDLSVPGYPNVFVIGDMASYVDPDTDKPVPGVAQGAMQMGDFVGKIIRNELTDFTTAEDRPTFHFTDKGSLATIGKAKAVASIWGRTFAGFPAWVIWSLVHIMFLVGFRNKVIVMVSWIWNFLVNSKGARLITGKPRIELTRALGLEPIAGDDDGKTEENDLLHETPASTQS